MTGSETTFELFHSPHTPKTRIPAVGFGVYKAAGGVDTVLTALSLGYKHLDTAQLYENEAEVGQAVIRSGIPRNELFITTKMMYPLPGGFEENLEAVRQSVRLSSGQAGKWEGGEGYVDLFLIHNATSGPEGRKLLWTVLEKLREEGGTREIGVSNYGIKHLEELATYATHLPVANQLELHPWCQQPALADYCKSKNILLQAYTPLVRGQKMGDPTLVAIAKAHGVTPGQVLVRWSLQKGFNPLPKSDNPERIKLNKEVFTWKLTDDDMQKLGELGKGLEDGQGAVCPYLVDCA